MNHDDPVQRVFDELTQIEPDKDAVHRSIARARECVLSQPTVPRSRLWGRVVRGPQLATAAGLLLAVSLAAWFALGGSNRTVAFAEVQKQLDAIQTVQFTVTHSPLPREGKKRGPSWVIRHQILGRYRERSEVLSVTPGEELEGGNRWNAPTPGRVSIIDLQRGAMISLTPEKKQYSVITGFASMSPDDGSLEKSELKPVPEADFYRQMRAIPFDKAEKLDERVVEGKKVTGFRTVEETKRSAGTDTWTRTYWVDSQTKLPVRIEVDVRSTHPNIISTRGVLSDFVFDEPLDESLFSADPPVGYVDARNAPREEAAK
jgi:outer membrane lipoprotein-sorting protein